MSSDRYARFEIQKPEDVGEAHWSAITVELERLDRSLRDNDDAQALGDLKCLIEAIAKVVLDINGTPAAGTSKFQEVVGDAHKLLAHQPGRELAFGSDFGNLAVQARKMAVSMASIRNDFGGGHGRGRQPELRDEMLDLAMDGAMLWARWATRRLGYFSEGRPETLIRDLVGDPSGQAIFRAGQLRERLLAADLPNAEPMHARAIGVAVGQRAARATFVVWTDGVDACIQDGQLEAWPVPYRLGVATGLLFTPDGRPSFATTNLYNALRVLEPVRDNVTDVCHLLGEFVRVHPPGLLPENDTPTATLLHYVKQTGPSRPDAEQAAWAQLEQNISFTPWV